MGEQGPSRSGEHRSFWREYTLSDPDKPCPRCSYSLVGLDSAAARCPECGWELTLADRLAEYRFQPVWESVRTICALPAASAMVMLLLLFATSFLGEGLLLIGVFAAGGCWLVSGAIMTIALLGQLVHQRALRQGVQRQEHVFRVFIASVGLVVIMVMPVLILAIVLRIVVAGP